MLTVGVAAVRTADGVGPACADTTATVSTATQAPLKRCVLTLRIPRPHILAPPEECSAHTRSTWSSCRLPTTLVSVDFPSRADLLDNCSGSTGNTLAEVLAGGRHETFITRNHVYF